jgi:hypothetical protein
MKMRKKKEFGKLKAGAKFLYKRCLYVKDNLNFGVRLSNGKVTIGRDGIKTDILVTPVKVGFMVK